MDLTIKLENTALNIRVVIIMETENGFVFGKNKQGFYHCLGGRIKLNESSLQAAKRETHEETGLDINDFKFLGIIENFFNSTAHDTATEIEKVHEINFVYKTQKQEIIDKSLGMVELNIEEIKDLDIRPEIIKKIILENKLNETSHFIV